MTIEMLSILGAVLAVSVGSILPAYSEGKAVAAALEAIARQPEAGKYARGMPGGLDNPLGARVLYLYQNGVYTLYTIYSTSAPETIGNGITSGCTGLLSQDMIDLYARTPVKTKVIVLPA